MPKQSLSPGSTSAFRGLFNLVFGLLTLAFIIWFLYYVVMVLIWLGEQANAWPFH